MTVTPDVEAVVHAEHDAYNDHDLERLLSYYAPDAVILDGDGKLLDEGIDAVRMAMARVFEQMPDVHVERPTVFHVGEWVAIHDIVPNWRVGDGPEHEMQWVALYRVVNGKIWQLQLFS
jgi:uncharacterized protein (TIGR02246 family)